MKLSRAILFISSTVLIVAAALGGVACVDIHGSVKDDLAGQGYVPRLAKVIFECGIGQYYHTGTGADGSYWYQHNGIIKDRSCKVDRVELHGEQLAFDAPVEPDKPCYFAASGWSDCTFTTGIRDIPLDIYIDPPLEENQHFEILYTGCEHYDPDPPPYTVLPFEDYTDIVYGYGDPPHPKHKLDIAIPDAPGPFPLIVVIHAGVWVLKDKTSGDLPAKAQEVAADGYVVANINHRQGDGNPATGFLDADTGEPLKYPDHLEDVRCALRYLIAHASDYRIDTSYIFLVGGSSGGQLSLLTAMTANEDPSAYVPEGDNGEDWCDGLGDNYADWEDVNIAGVIALATPTDFVNWERSDYPIFGGLIDIGAAQAFADMLGMQEFDPNDPVAALASPITHVDAGDPPVLLVNGGEDEVIMTSQGIRMSEALDSVSVNRTYMELPLHDHDDTGYSWLGADRLPYGGIVVTCTGLNFIKEISSP